VARKFLAGMGLAQKAGPTESFGLEPLRVMIMIGGRSGDGVAAVELYFAEFKCILRAATG
jgi:hypothetical protein